MLVRRVRALTLAIALVLVGLAGRARADDVATKNPHLVKARAELDDLHYDAARSELDQALATGDNGPAELADIYRLSAQVAAALGDDVAAQSYFAHLLALEPRFTLPGGTSPKIAEPFAAARSSLGGKSLLARYVVDSTGPTARVLIDDDPLSMAVGATISYTADDGEPDTITSKSGPPFTLNLPKAKRIVFTLAVIDEHGNRLVEFGTSDSPLLLESKNTPPPKKPHGGGDHGRPLYARWWLWGGVAMVAAGAGTYFGLDVLAAQDDIIALNKKSVEMPPVDFSEAQAIETRGKRSALLTNVSFGVAGVATIAAIVCVVTGGGDHAGAKTDTPPSDDDARLVPTVGAGTIGLTFVSPW